MEINLGAQRLHTELVMADAAEGDTLRETLAEVSAEKDVIEQQIQLMSTLDELKGSADAAPPAAASSSSGHQGKEVFRDRLVLLQENDRLWKELEQTKVALAVEAALRRNMLSDASGPARYPSVTISRSMPASEAADSPTHNETTLLRSLRKAGKKAKSAVKRVGQHSAGASPTHRSDTEWTSQHKSTPAPRTPDDAAAHIREQMQRDRRSSVTASIVARLGAETPSPFPSALHAVPGSAQNSKRSETPDFSNIAEYAMHQLDEAHAFAKAVELQREVGSRKFDPIHPAALGLTPVQANKSPGSYYNGDGAHSPPVGDGAREHLARLTPSMPQVPSRHNTLDRHTTAHHLVAGPAGTSAGNLKDMDYSPGMQQVHFSSYVEPHAFDVAPPATPHPSKGLLNPPHDAGSLDSSHRMNGVNALPDGDQQLRQQVAFEAVSPRVGSPAAPTPHHSHGFLQRGFNDGYIVSSMDVQQDNGYNQYSPDRSVSFKVACGRNVFQSSFSEQGIDGPGAMRCLDRSPGCTPVVGGTPTARVRMQSRPGHDNFAPMKSSTASPGGTPHARGQGRLPHVRVCHVDAAGHLEFNPMRCGTASPGCTPLPSTPHSGGSSDLGIPAAGGERDLEDNWPGAHNPQQGSAAIPAHFIPGFGHSSPPGSQDTDLTGHMHMVVVGQGAGDRPDVGSHYLAACGYAGHGAGRSVSIVCDRNNEGFFPLNAGDRSPGHTPATPGLLATGGSIDPHVRFISSGHDSFNPLTSNSSPGHTPHACGYSASAQCSDGGVYVMGGGQSERRVSICTDRTHADNFQPLICEASSPGHTPRVCVSQGGNVTMVCTPGHDHFQPIRSDAHSAGNTPRHCPSSRSGGGPDSGPTDSSAILHVNINAPHCHDHFNPMHNGAMSPGHTPYYPQHFPSNATNLPEDLPQHQDGTGRGGAQLGNPPSNSFAAERPRTSRGRRPADSSESSHQYGQCNEVSSHSVDVKPENGSEVVVNDSQQTMESMTFSNDGTALPASVRDAAMRALQSSESVRRRLINAAEDTDNMIAKNVGKRHRPVNTAEHPTTYMYGTAAPGSSTNNEHRAASAAHNSADAVSDAENAQTTSILMSMSSDVPARPTLSGQIGWNAPRPASAPVFEDPPADYQGLYGKKAAYGSSGSSRGSRMGGGGAVPTSSALRAAGTRPTARRSVSITDQWLSPSDLRKSGGGSDSFAFNAAGRPSSQSVQSVDDVFGLPPRHPSLPEVAEMPKGNSTTASSPARQRHARDYMNDPTNSALVMQRLPVRSMREYVHGSCSSRAASESGALV